MSIKQDCKHTVSMAEKDGVRALDRSAEYTFRGLEAWPELESRASRDKTQAAVRLVIEIQYQLRQAGLINPRVIADRYKKITSDCKAEAHMRGLNDEEVVAHQESHSARKRQRIGSRRRGGKKSSKRVGSASLDRRRDRVGKSSYRNSFR